MSCMFCKFYEGLNEYCLRGLMVESGNESFDCNYYEYNGELKHES
jgi:hypothetical protein